MNATMRLTAQKLSVRYATRPVLHETSLALAVGELVGLVGPNGAGKSTLLRALAGLTAASGRVRVDDVPIERLAARERARRIAYVPQAPPVHWPMRVRELVALGRLPHRAYGLPPTAADDEAVARALAATNTAAFAERSVNELSMGERARVLLARALAVEAPALLLDEPIAMLDPYHQLEIMTLLRRYTNPADGAERLAVVVLHDLTLAARFCTRVLLMNHGNVVADGAPGDALDAAAIRHHYRVEPLVAEHEGGAVIVPWRAIAD